MLDNPLPSQIRSDQRTAHHYGSCWPDLVLSRDAGLDLNEHGHCTLHIRLLISVCTPSAPSWTLQDAVLHYYEASSHRLLKVEVEVFGFFVLSGAIHLLVVAWWLFLPERKSLRCMCPLSRRRSQSIRACRGTQIDRTSQPLAPINRVQVVVLRSLLDSGKGLI